MSRRTTRLAFALSMLVVAGVAPVRAADPVASGQAPAPAEEERFIVVLDPGTNVAAAADRAEATVGADVEREFRRLGAYVAEMTEAEAEQLELDPSVRAVVPDEPIELTGEPIPTGISRINGPTNQVASIDGFDTRVDADIAIVDTGIDPAHPDLNVAGGYNCTTSDRAAWSDGQGHGTHVAGTAAALDNGFGVVGVAPGARLWAVRILNSNGFGYLSWYVCGLDWIAAQRDPADPSRPLFEAVNMSVAKDGRDDGACGARNDDILHAAVCRLVASGVTVVAAAANDSGPASARVPAAYNEVITVSALADTDGVAGGLGGNACSDWDGYDRDDTFANFSNYGGDVDLIAPGKCIYSTRRGNRYGTMSGTSMAAPHVAGAVALFKASRPLATPAEVRSALRYLGSMNWATSTDPDAYHEPLLDVAAVAALGDFSIAAGLPVAPAPEIGGTVQVPVTIARSSTFFEGVGLAASAPAPLVATPSAGTLYGWSAVSASINVTVPKGTPAGEYPITITATNWGRIQTTTATVTVVNDLPSALPASTWVRRTTLGTAAVPLVVTWPAATDPSSPVDAYEVETQIDGGPWSPTTSLPAARQSLAVSVPTGSAVTTRVRARDAAGNWSDWATSPPVVTGLVQDSSSAVRWSGTWSRYSSSSASGGTARYSTRAGASATHTFTGSGVALVMPKGPTRGHARIWLDGALAGTISLYRSTGVSRQIVFSKTWAESGSHTIRVEVVGTRGRPRVDLDAIVILQ
ncbi:MAG TPA: S8 family serine peptidase [Candidatus Limnocylindrales bacterium]|nr:S8 family serine peptidase [Candidatus Limnocylindrales bacterium]